MAIAAFVFGDISGGVVNPAITLGAAVAGKLPPARTVPYIAAQIAGGIVAGLILGFIFAHDHSGTHMGPYGDLGATLINTKLTTLAGGFVLEMLGTFFLMSTVVHTAMSDRAGAVAPLAIRLTISISVMFFGGLTGASLNPARTSGRLRRVYPHLGIPGGDAAGRDGCGAAVPRDARDQGAPGR